MKKRISGCHHWALFDQTFSSLALTSKDVWWFMRTNSSSRYKDLLTRNIMNTFEENARGARGFFLITILLIENSLVCAREMPYHWAVSPAPLGYFELALRPGWVYVNMISLRYAEIKVLWHSGTSHRYHRIAPQTGVLPRLHSFPQDCYHCGAFKAPACFKAAL